MNTYEKSTTMTIVVTGASGNVGIELVDALSAEGHRVLALSRNPAATLIPREPRWWRETCPTSGAKDAFEGVDAVFLLGGYPNGGRRPRSGKDRQGAGSD